MSLQHLRLGLSEVQSRFLWDPQRRPSYMRDTAPRTLQKRRPRLYPRFPEDTRLTADSCLHGSKPAHPWPEARSTSVVTRRTPCDMLTRDFPSC